MVEYATIEKTAEGFKKVAERMAEVEKNASSDLEVTKEAIDTLYKQMKLYRTSMITGRTPSGEVYNRCWLTDGEAEEFGKIVLMALGKSMGEGEATAGGYLVPEELAVRLIELMGRYGKFRKDAIVLPMNSDRIVVPKVSADLTVYAPGEGSEITASDMVFGQVGLNATKLCCLTAFSSELEEDAVMAIGEIVGRSIVRSLAKKEDLIGFLGDGTETYFGMTGIVGALRAVDETIGNIAGLIVGAGNAYAELTLANFRSVAGLLPEEYDEDAKWYMSKKFYYNVIYPLAETAGVASIFEILSNRKGKFLLGYPVEFVSSMPSTEANSQICAILGELSMGAYLGERRELKIDRSDQRYFEKDLIGIRGIERIDVNAFGVGGTTNPGPIVALITAAA